MLTRRISLALLMGTLLCTMLAAPSSAHASGARETAAGFDTQVARLLTNKNLWISSPKARCLSNVAMAALKKNRAVHPERAFRQCETNQVTVARVVRARKGVTAQEVAKRMRSNGFKLDHLRKFHLGVATKIVNGRRFVVAVAARQKGNPEPVPQSPTAVIWHFVEGSTVHLDAGSSVVDKGNVTYEWAVSHDGQVSPVGTGVTLDYTVPAPGTYTFLLEVTDADGNRDQSSQVVHVSVSPKS